MRPTTKAPVFRDSDIKPFLQSWDTFSKSCLHHLLLPEVKKKTHCFPFELNTEDDELRFSSCHTRSLTIFNALMKLSLVPDVGSNAWTTLHICGSGLREGFTSTETLSVFDALLCLMENRGQGVKLVLIGPELEGVTASNTEVTKHRNGLLCAIEYSPLIYQHFMKSSTYEKPSLIVCFNAGLWAFSEWTYFLKAVSSTQDCPCLITCYNERDAVKDMKVVSQGCPEMKWIWVHEVNPFASQLLLTNQEDPMYESHSWFCLIGPLHSRYAEALTYAEYHHKDKETVFQEY